MVSVKRMNVLERGGRDWRRYRFDVLPVGKGWRSSLKAWDREMVGQQAQREGVGKRGAGI